MPLAWLSPRSHLSMCAFASSSLRMLFQVFSGLTHLSSLHSAIASSVTAQSTVAPQCPHTSVPSHHLITALHFPSTYHSLKSFFFNLLFVSSLTSWNTGSMSTSPCLSCSYGARARQAARGSPQEVHGELMAKHKPRCHPPKKKAFSWGGEEADTVCDCN